MMPALLSRTSRCPWRELLEAWGPLPVAHVEGAGDPLGVVGLTLARPSASASGPAERSSLLYRPARLSPDLGIPGRAGDGDD